MNNDNKTNVDDIDLFFHQEFNELLDNKVEIKFSNDDEVEILNFDNDAEILDLETEVTSEPEVLDFEEETIFESEILNIDNQNIPVLDDIEEPEILDFQDIVLNEHQENQLKLSENNTQNNYMEKVLIDDVSSNVLLKKPKHKKIKKIFLVIDLLILFILLSLVLLKIIDWNNDNNYTDKQIKEIQSNIVIEESGDNENTVIINNESNENNDVEPTTPNNDYYNFIKEPLISVDFTNLKEKNSDTVGWIQVPGTNINYPVVQTIDNNYYLTHSFDRTYNDAGWVFVDYRNNLYDDRNLIIYGHARLNLTMFGTLKNVVKSSWYTNNYNHLIKLSTPNLNTSWQVFSTYVVDEEDYYIKTFFNTDDEYLDFLKTLKGRSVYNYNTSVSVSDRILTLSTCYTNNRRVVLHAKLIKMEQR